MKFFDRLSKIAKISNYMKIRPVRTELFPTDRRADRQTWRS